MPPATLGTVRAPPAPVVRPKPHWNPDSNVVGPTSALNEKVPPGGTTTPFRRWAARRILCAFSGTEPAKVVVLSSISSRMPRLAPASSDGTAGRTVDTGN